MGDQLEIKLDRVLGCLPGVQEIPVLLKIMEVLGLEPSEKLDTNNRRAIVRSLTNYLYDERHIDGDPKMEERLDQILYICTKMWIDLGRNTGEVKTEERGIQQPYGGARSRNEGEENIDIPGIGPQNDEDQLLGAMAAPQGTAVEFPNVGYDLLGDFDEVGEGMNVAQQIPPVLTDMRRVTMNVPVVDNNVPVTADHVSPFVGNVPAAVENVIPVLVDAPAVVDGNVPVVDPNAAVAPGTPIRPIPKRRPRIPAVQQMANIPAVRQMEDVAQRIIPVAQQMAHIPALQQMDDIAALPGVPNNANPVVNNFPVNFDPVFVAPAANVYPVQPGNVAAHNVRPGVRQPAVNRQLFQQQRPVLPPAQPVVHPFVRSPFRPNAPAQAPVVAPHAPVAPVYAPAQAPVVAHHAPVVYAPVNPAPAPVPNVPVGNLLPVPHFNPPRVAQPAGYYGRLREFKINGKIVDPGVKDGITYGSLMYQVESARAQGYTDVDIGAAIIKATNSTALRSVLEAKPGATLGQIVPSLKAHFTVKGVRSVFMDLGAGKQGKDSALQFCMNMIGLRELVVRMNREENGDLTHQLIHSQFLNALSTGLKGKIRQAMRGTLRVPNVTDDVLMQEITELMLSEAEAEEKEVETEDATVSSVTHGTPQQNNKKDKTKNPLLSEISKISVDVKNLGAMQPQIDDLRKELKQQQRVFSMMHLTPQQRQMMMSEHPQMLPERNDPVYNYDQYINYGYDPQHAVNRGGQGGRGGYRGGSGYGRGNYQNSGGGGRGGYSNRGLNRGGAGNVAGLSGNVDSNNNNDNISNNTNTNNPQNNTNNVNNVNNNDNNNPVSASQGGFVRWDNGNGSSNRGYHGNRGSRGSNRGGRHGLIGRQNFSCVQCFQLGNPNCNHCFQCGGAGHCSRDCPLN